MGPSMSELIHKNGIVHWIDERGQTLFYGDEKSWQDVQVQAKRGAENLAKEIDEKIFQELSK
jgi:hypothetical protein